MSGARAMGAPIAAIALPIVVALIRISLALGNEAEDAARDRPVWDAAGVDVPPPADLEAAAQHPARRIVDSRKEEAIEHLKEVLGIRGGAKNESRGEIPPQFMMELYSIIADSNSGARGKNPYNAKIVRSFVGKESSSPHGYIFNVSALEQNELVLEAELHLYRKTSSPSSVPPSVLYSPHYLIKVYQVLPDRSLEEPDFHRLLNVHYVGAYESGWEVFNVKQAVLSWLSGVPNLGFLVTATTIFGDRVTVDFSRRNDQPYDKQPILVLFNDINTDINNINAPKTNGGYEEKGEKKEKENEEVKEDEQIEYEKSEDVEEVTTGISEESARTRNKRGSMGQMEMVPEYIEDHWPIHFLREKKDKQHRERNKGIISQRASPAEAITSMDVYERAVLREQLRSRRRRRRKSSRATVPLESGRRKRSTWPLLNLTEAEGTASSGDEGRLASRPDCRRAEETEPCARRELYVNFRDIGLATIIAPEGYAAYQCRGHCRSPLSQDQRPTNHATIQLIPRLGRRAGHGSFQEDKSDEDLLDSPEPLSSAKSSTKGPAPPVPSRARKTGWGDDLKSAKPRGVTVVDQDQFVNNSKSEKENEIPVIPDLDEIIEETEALNISDIPSVGINRAAAYKELDTDIIKNQLFSMLDEIDLSLLTEKLYPENLVKEPDEVWSWESLFTQVASEINNESQTKGDRGNEHS